MASSAKETRERFRRARVPATIALWVVSIGMLWAFFRTTERTGIGLILGGTLLLTVAIGASILQIALGIRSGWKKARTARALGVRAKDIDYFDGHWFFPKPQLPQFDPEFHEAAFDRSEPVEIVDHYDENWDPDDDRPNPNFFRLTWKDAATGRKRHLALSYTGGLFMRLVRFFDRWHIPYTFKEISDSHRELYEAYTEENPIGISERDRERSKYGTCASPERP